MIEHVPVSKNITAYTKLINYLSQVNPQKGLEFGWESLKVSPNDISQKKSCELYLSIAICHNHLSNFDSAIFYQNQALNLAKEIGSDSLQVRIFTQVGETYAMQHGYDKSVDYYKRGLEIQKTNPDIHATCHLLNNLGEVYLKSERHYEALQYFHTAHTLATNENLIDMDILSTLRIGDVHYEMEQYELSLDFYEKALLKSQAGGFRKLKAAILTSKGKLYMSTQNYSMASDNLNEAHMIHQSLQNKFEQAMVIDALGDLYLDRKEISKAYNAYKKAFKIRKQIGVKEGLASSYLKIAQINIQQNNYNKALINLQQAEILASEVGAENILYQNYLLKAKVHEQRNHLDQAFKFQKIANELLDSTHLAHQKLLLITNPHFQTQEVKDRKIKDLVKEKEELKVTTKQQDEQINDHKMLIGTLITLISITGIVAVIMASVSHIRNEANRKLAIKEKVLSDRLDEALGELDTYMYRTCHDIKGPLTTMEGLSTLGMLETSDSVAKDYFKRQQQVSRKMQGLLENISQVSNLRYHQKIVEPINIRNLSEKTVNEICANHDYGKTQFLFEIPEKATVVTDITLLKITLGHLIENAVIHRKPAEEGHTPYVKVRLVDNKNSWWIQVADNGYGIPKEVSEKVFSMFYKNSINQRSAGLGLYQAKMAIEKAGGIVRLRENQEDSTLFEIILPKDESMVNFNTPELNSSTA